MNKQQFHDWLQTKSFQISGQRNRPLVMGILNVTSDSFFDGGRFFNHQNALSHARQLISQGADIIDIGGESSRPGSQSISVNEELDRVLPIIELIAKESDICLSIDTCKPEVMQSAINAGAAIINDITALASQQSMSHAAKMQVPICLMHMQGTPASMQQNPHYTNIIDEMNHFFTEKISECLRIGIARDNLIIDPGFGFGKTVQHNLTLVKNLQQLAIHQLPVLLGVSRKHTLGQILNKPPEGRLIGSIVLTVIGAMQNAAIIRTHDVDETIQALQVVTAINNI